MRTTDKLSHLLTIACPHLAPSGARGMVKYYSHETGEVEWTPATLIRCLGEDQVYIKLDDGRTTRLRRTSFRLLIEGVAK